MQRLFLYPLFAFICAMKCFTASGSDRLVCLLRYVKAFLVKLIVESALLLFFICMSTFKILAVCGKIGLVFGCKGLERWP